MNRLRSAGGRLPALLALIISAIVLAAACGNDQPTPPTESERQQTVAADQPEKQVQPEQPAAQSSAADTEQSQDDPQQAETRIQPHQSQDESTQSSQPQAQQSQTVQEDDGLPALTLQPILGGRQFEQPVEMLELNDNGWYLIAEQRGSITVFIEQDGSVRQIGVFDLTESVNFRGEQGLLSMAMHPTRPFLYVYYSPRGENVTRLSRFRYQIIQGSAIPSEELVIVDIPQPYANHNGGAVRFGSDGMLYLGLGDGGAANDPHGHGQNTETLLGSIIRIDVRESTASRPYRIPTDNPFLGRAGFRPEIWAFGLRNPWRMAFDQETGELWVGDVGQDRFEEIAVVRAGENHGWNVFEGHECFRSNDDCAALSDVVAPVATYGHDEGCSVTGGVVYRGQALPHLSGVYIFGDYCSGTIWGLWPDDPAEAGWSRRTILKTDHLIASFAVDREGEIYVLAFNAPILKLTPESP